MSRINVIWTDRNRLRQHSSFSPFFDRLQRYMTRVHHYNRCTEQTIVGRMLLKSLFPCRDWHWLLNEIEYSSFGKPFLRNKSLQFNISHTGDMVVLAYAESINMGVDIVRIGQRHEHTEFFLHKEESENEENTGSLFFLNSVWAKKEAMGKLTGEGWGIGFPGINSLQPVYYEGRRIHFLETMLTEEYYCAVSTENESFLVETKQLDANDLIPVKNLID